MTPVHQANRFGNRGVSTNKDLDPDDDARIILDSDYHEDIYIKRSLGRLTTVAPRSGEEPPVRDGE